MVCVVSVGHRNKNALGHCVWLVLFAWNDGGCSRRAWSKFSFPVAKERSWLTFSLTVLLLILRTYSSQSFEENGCTSVCKPIVGVKLTPGLSGVLLQGLEVHKHRCTNLLCVWNAGRVTTILSHPYLSPKYLRAGSLAFPVKHIFSSALLVYMFSAECVSVVKWACRWFVSGVQAV